MASLRFAITGLGKKMEICETISLEYPGHNGLLAVLKAMADAITKFSKSKPHQISRNYFELLDYRVLENYPATEPVDTLEYIISKIKPESRDVVKIFYDFIIPLAKCQIKGSIGHYWTPDIHLKTYKKSDNVAKNRLRKP